MALSMLRAAAGSRLSLFGRWPITARHVDPSSISSPSRGPSKRVLEIALEAVAGARAVDLEWLAARDPTGTVDCA